MIPGNGTKCLKGLMEEDSAVSAPVQSMDVPVSAPVQSMDVPVSAPVQSMEVPVSVPVQSMEVPVSAPVQSMELPVSVPVQSMEVPVNPEAINPIIPPHIIAIRDQLNGLTVEEINVIRRRFVLNNDVLQYAAVELQMSAMINEMEYFHRGIDIDRCLLHLFDLQVFLASFEEVHDMNDEERLSYLQYGNIRTVDEVIAEIDSRILQLTNGNG